MKIGDVVRIKKKWGLFQTRRDETLYKLISKPDYYVAIHDLRREWDMWAERVVRQEELEVVLHLSL